VKAPRIATLALLLLFASSCKKCSDTPVGPVVQVIVDCLQQDQSKIGSLASELLPLITGANPDWSTFYAKAKDAGINIGGCVAADLINRYLAPPPGNAAPAPEAGQAARATMDKLRADFGGATFKTAQGTL
jgi:hypothetical protein